MNKKPGIKPLTVGIAGTAKNTGKTTTLSAIMDEVKKQSGLTLGLTSIGYDGEGFDNVTGLPKPRIEVWPGNIVAIAEKCNKFSSAAMETIKQTDISTPLGKVVINRVVSRGKVVLAGANNRRELRTVLDLLCELVNIIIVDGALNRIAPMAEADCLIFVTGAARHPDIPRLTLESRCMVDLLSTPALEELGIVETAGSIFNRAGFEALAEKFSAADTVRIHGIMGEQFLKELIDLSSHRASNRLANKRLIFDDPIKLLLAGDAVAVSRILQQIAAGSITIGVAKATKLLAVTVNPYYPQYRYNMADYVAAYVDAANLLESVGGNIEIPCYDVVRQGGQDIFQKIMDYRTFSHR